MFLGIATLVFAGTFVAAAALSYRYTPLVGIGGLLVLMLVASLL